MLGMLGNRTVISHTRSLDPSRLVTFVSAQGYGSDVAVSRSFPLIYNNNYVTTMHSLLLLVNTQTHDLEYLSYLSLRQAKIG